MLTLNDAIDQCKFDYPPTWNCDALLNSSFWLRVLLQPTNSNAIDLRFYVDDADSTPDPFKASKEYQFVFKAPVEDFPALQPAVVTVIKSFKWNKL